MSRKFMHLVDYTPPDRTIEKEVLYTSAGEYIPEKDFVQTLLSKKVEDISSASSETDRFNAQIENIKNIANVIRSEPSIATESVNTLIINMYQLAGLDTKGNRTIATESYQENLVATEGFGSFLKKAWEMLKKFIVGFFKGLRDFFYTILGLDIPINKRKVSLKEQIIQIKRHNLSIDLDKRIKIETRLPDMLNIPNPIDANYDMVLARSEQMMGVYDSYFNKTVLVSLKLVREELLPKINNMLDSLKTEVSSEEQLMALFNSMLLIVNSANDLRKVFANEEINFSQMPDDIRTRIEDNLNDSPLAYNIYSVFSPSRPSEWLCREYNGFAIQHKGLENIRDINDISKPNIEFYYECTLRAKEDLTITAIEPVSTARMLESISDSLNKSSRVMDFKKIMGEVESTDRAIDKTITNVTRNIGLRIEKLEQVVTGEYDYKDAFVKGIINLSGTGENDDILMRIQESMMLYFISSGEQMPEWVSNLVGDEKQLGSVILTILMTRSDKYMEKDLNKHANLINNYMSWVVQNPEQADIYGIQPKTPEGGITPEMEKAYSALPEVIDTVLRKSFTSLQRLIAIAVVEPSKTYREFEVELVDYLNASASQFR